MPGWLSCGSKPQELGAHSSDEFNVQFKIDFIDSSSINPQRLWYQNPKQLWKSLDLQSVIDNTHFKCGNELAFGVGGVQTVSNFIREEIQMINEWPLLFCSAKGTLCYLFASSFLATKFPELKRNLVV